MWLIFSIFTSIKNRKTNRLWNHSKSAPTGARIRAYGRTELAQCYFPSLTPQSAYRKLESWIDYHPTLRDRLRATSGNPHSRVYMPVQVRLIVEAIGEP